MSTSGIINTTFNNPSARVEMDYYPTPPEATSPLLAFLSSIKLDLGRIWEPACGEGDISDVLIHHGYNVYSSDIRDTGYGAPNIDYLQSTVHWKYTIITNPPFSLAEEFIKKSMSANIVCMLLKANYFHAAKRIALFNKFTPAYILPLTFRPNWMFKTKKSSSPTMDVSWYVWVKGSISCQYIPISKIV